jgi:hypothetical protein
LRLALISIETTSIASIALIPAINQPKIQKHSPGQIHEPNYEKSTML